MAWKIWAKVNLEISESIMMLVADLFSYWNSVISFHRRIIKDRFPLFMSYVWIFSRNRRKSGFFLLEKFALGKFLFFLCYLLYFFPFPSPLDSYNLHVFYMIFWCTLLLWKITGFFRSTTQWQFDQSFPILLVLSPRLLILLIIAAKKVTCRTEKSLGLVCCKFKVQKIITNKFLSSYILHITHLKT